MKQKGIRKSPVLDHNGNQFNVSTFAGADSSSKELSSWYARNLSGDAAILPDKDRLTARTQDIARNNGYASHGIQLHVDNIVGHQYKLSYKPFWIALGIDPDTDAARVFVRQVEAIWNSIADSPECPLDAERKRTFTDMIRQGVSARAIHGETLRSVEYLNRRGIQTAFKVINPDRLCNPNDLPDTARLKAGVRVGPYGDARVYYIRQAHQSDTRFTGSKTYSWKAIAKLTPWGRSKIIHTFDATEDGQTRGISKFAPVLERFKMLDKLQKLALEKAILNAMYAMVIESEFDTETAMSAIGADDSSFTNYLDTVAGYHEGVNIRFGGAKIPHLFPNEKLRMLATDTPINSDFEDRLLRYTAAGFGVSYEQFASNWSQTNYSSARAALGESWRYFLGEKVTGPDRDASLMFSAVLEEMISKNMVTLPPTSDGRNKSQLERFLENKGAWCHCAWIGAGRTMIDGLKEVKELVLKIESGLTTYEKALATLGEDYQEVFSQQVREMRERKEAGLPTASWAVTQSLAPDAENENPQSNTNSQAA